MVNEASTMRPGTKYRLRMKCGEDPTAGNKMFLQWCGDVSLKVLSSFNV